METLSNELIEQMKVTDTASMRVFETGATRNVDNTKIDPEGFLSPSVIQAFSDYMNSHRMQADGKLRASDNWAKGIPQDAYMKSMWRHFLDVWSIHRGIARFDETGKEIDKVEALCATLFNVQGMLHEELKRKAELKKPCKAIYNHPFTYISPNGSSGVDEWVGTGTVTSAVADDYTPTTGGSLSEEMLKHNK